MGHQGIAINDMCEEEKIKGLQPMRVMALNAYGKDGYERLWK